MTQRQNAQRRVKTPNAAFKTLNDAAAAAAAKPRLRQLPPPQNRQQSLASPNVHRCCCCCHCRCRHRHHSCWCRLPVCCQAWRKRGRGSDHFHPHSGIRFQAESPEHAMDRQVYKRRGGERARERGRKGAGGVKKRLKTRNTSVGYGGEKTHRQNPTKKTT